MIGIISCDSRFKKPIIFSYNDKEIEVKVSLDSLNYKKDLYKGDLIIKNLSDREIIASNANLQICLIDSNNIGYPVSIDSIASVGYYIKPYNSSNYKIIVNVKNTQFTKNFRISVVNRIFDKKLSLKDSLSKCN